MRRWRDLWVARLQTHFGARAGIRAGMKTVVLFVLLVAAASSLLATLAFAVPAPQKRLPPIITPQNAAHVRPIGELPQDVWEMALSSLGESLPAPGISRSIRYLGIVHLHDGSCCRVRRLTDRA